ncbi:DUF3540 domain-containing protein [Serratia sp. AKBS12]|uniref:DUF3540 domain-containing protein n=1 Tax=Serratia sp. AKBS12 TaxID=2974597 RepID=UPI0021653303|nr:DUF3540 domain-containing protein [Serratia sp. AKBS12]MCS3408369.1 DUF3540 domain-containing protein [Serratia sp. AKBS12]
MSRIMQAEMPPMQRTLAVKDDYAMDCRLPSGTQVIADVRLDVHGCLYLASYAAYDLQVATSCLLKPQEGDRIRAIVDQKKLFVTDILSRKQSGPLIINSGESELHIQAAGLTLNGGHHLDIYAEKISLRSKMAKWISEQMNQVAKRWFVQADDAYRKIKHNEDVEAKNISFQAEDMLALKGRLTSVSGSAVVKVDGSQIHMG